MLRGRRRSRRWCHRSEKVLTFFFFPPSFYALFPFSFVNYVLMQRFLFDAKKETRVEWLRLKEGAKIRVFPFWFSAAAAAQKKKEWRSR